MSAHDKTKAFLHVLGSRGLTRQVALDYASLLGGQVGRLIFSVLFFVTLASSLSLGDFGLYATSSAIGVVLARISGFGFISPLYRVATTKPQLIGVYTAGYLTAVLLSAPLVIALTYGIHAALYSSIMPFAAFALIITAEVLFWRSLEAVIIVLNGTQKFTTASGLTIVGSATRALAAVIFSIYGHFDLSTWAIIYCIANAILALLAIIFFYPKKRLRWKPKAWFGRIRDALGVSAAEALFYIQSELDKVLVLALGGEIIAGTYAIIMRLVDLTAIPFRALNTMLIQWIMRQRQSRKHTQFGLLMDLGIGTISSFGLAIMWLLLSIAPKMLGDNITLGASFLLLVILVPAFRNIIEYHTELLYAHERMTPRVLLLASLAFAKASLLTLLISTTTDLATIAWWLNGVFAVLYLLSATVTYRGVLNGKSTVVKQLDRSP